MQRTLALLVGVLTACTASREPADTPPPPPTTSEDLALWNNRCVVAEGYATRMGIGPELHFGGPSIGVTFDTSDDDPRWDVEIGSWVRVRGTVVERLNLSELVDLNGAPAEARMLWVIEQPIVTQLRSLAQVHSDLMAQVGKTVELRGLLVLTSYDQPRLMHDGIDLYLDFAQGVEARQYNGEGVTWSVQEGVTLVGQMSREIRPHPVPSNSPEMAEAFVLKVETIRPHPAAKLEACPT